MGESHKPWVQTRAELDALAVGGDGRVVLTHPARATHESLALGQVIDWALSGPTKSFTVVVGYFNHQGHEPDAKRRSVPAPAEIVQRELVDERGRSPGFFRLLFGRALTQAAAHALRSWYWICRWRHAEPELALRWRDELVPALDTLLARSPATSAAELAAFGRSWLTVRGRPPFDRALNAPADHMMRLLRLDDDGLRRFEAWRAAFLEPVVSDPILDLLLFFVRNRAAIRMDTTPEIASFHPKLYLVERGAREEHTEDAIIIAGSGNWSPGAFGRTSDLQSNVEVATVHRVAALHPAAWTASDAAPQPTDLGGCLAATAARLFAAGSSLASWDDPDALSPAELDERLIVVDPKLPGEKPPPETPTDPTPDDCIAPVLRALIERTLGLGDISAYALYERVLGGDKGVWGGRRPSRYQLDGALRLLAILEGAPATASGDVPRPAERGAFLTDEPGLGKTLIAQLVVSMLAAERLRAVHFGRRPDVPLRVSVIAPARIAGSAGDHAGNATGWHAAANEIREAVRLALAAFRSTSPDYLALDAGQLTERLDVRVFSATSFGRQPLGPEGEPAGVVLDDWLHVACSEIVVVDESHNFRNGQAAATRALRFLLTLPVPGEPWPLLTGEPAGTSDASAAAAPNSRKVLCLSATPFNNRLDDFVTQTAHFARYQAWCLPAAAQGDLFDALRGALLTWSDVRLSEPDRRAAFAVLVSAIARHLRSSRRLDEDEARAEARDHRARGRRRPEDEGPLYEWAPPYAELRRSFAQVLEWLQGYLEGRTSPEEESDARARVDALLARLVVQRSRRRILGMMQREGTLRSSFRAPELPRHPLAIGVEGDGARPSFEAKVLAKLYSLLAAHGVTAETQSEVGEDRLNLFAYEIGVRRGREHSGTGGADEVAIRNAVGFQATGLIKRLQSSPYAFLRTLARGPLRRALFELAVVEAIAFRSEDAGGDLAERVREAGRAAGRLADRLQRQWGARGEAVAGLVGGTWHAGSATFFRALVDVDSNDQRRRFESAVSSAGEAIAGARRKPRRESGEAPRWLELVLDDLASVRSKLWADVSVSLGWILEADEEGESEPLLDAIYRYLEDRHVGVPMDRLRTAILQGDAYAEPLAKWLRHRLTVDRRAGWLLGLCVALAAMDRENAFRDVGERLGPGGAKLLVFTEYSDTQSYLLALAAALFRTASDPSSRRLHQTLLQQVRVVAATLEEQTRTVTAAGGPARAFRSPIDIDWITTWLDRAQEEPAALHDAIAHACRGLAWASSRGAGLLEARGGGEAVVEQSTADEDEDEEEGNTALSDDPVLDAFSPWYQISPDPGREERRAAVRARMLKALESPVRTLLTTEILAEGVNLQECGIVAHYDLPWNPTRLIQRNGRVDRRLDPRFEDYEERVRLCEALDVPTAAAELYRPPAQIYHLTVLPIEPALLDGSGEAPAERVRRVLSRKLRSIRVLFGLASWPVVLRAEDAQRVLTGELEFETPGFRRRERLFEQWRALKDGSAGEAADEASGGVLVLRAGDAFFDALRVEAAGASAPSWDAVRAAMVQTSPRGRAVHSAVDWQVATSSGAELATAITGALLLREAAAVGWDYRQRRLGTVSRWSFMPTVLSLHDGRERSDVPCPLSAADDEGRSRVATSPTAFAEDILAMAIDDYLRGPGAAERHDGVPLPPVAGVQPESLAWLRWYLARPFVSGRTSVRFQEEELALAPPAGRWNLWVVREASATGDR